ncbi:hypothetical protein [Nocardia fluminea]|uniref:hypothetical protein n=1 Tax=Nocardia fluminea TaxID=134984 RepID=UPI0036548A62
MSATDAEGDRPRDADVSGDEFDTASSRGDSDLGGRVDAADRGSDRGDAVSDDSGLDDSPRGSDRGDVVSDDSGSDESPRGSDRDNLARGESDPDDRSRGAGRSSGSDRGDSARSDADRADSGRGDADRGERRGFADRGVRSDRDDRSRGGSVSRSGDAGDDRRRGGEGARAAGGRPDDRRAARPEEPDLPEDVEASDLDPAVRRDLLSLDKNNADSVARHMVMAVELLEDDPRLALAHARAARQRAGRIAVVRETAGVVAYHAEEWAEALSELRTARRMSGGAGLLAVMADCERGLGRPERAIELGRSEEAQTLTGDEAAELRMVVAGARMDLGQFDQAVVTLQASDLDPSRTGSAAARLFYAYADALVAAGRTDDGLQWFLNAAAADLDDETDAEERATELTGDAQ